jgi:tetraacyldisaccharide 4'-kinase
VRSTPSSTGSTPGPRPKRPDDARAGLLVSAAGPGLSRCFRPLGALYALGHGATAPKGPRAKVGVPVICIGNINAGGTGKTPTTIALAQRLGTGAFRSTWSCAGMAGRWKGPFW